MGGLGHRGHPLASKQFPLCPSQAAVRVGGDHRQKHSLTTQASPKPLWASLSIFLPGCWGGPASPN